MGSSTSKGAGMTWEKPEYVDINMSAEIGGYQDEFEERPPSEPSSLGQRPGSSQSNEA